MATAMHAKRKTRDGSVHAVGIHNLRVLLLQEDGHWFAQGVEIDYLACGKTLRQAKQNFERGLVKTIALNIEEDGNIAGILKWAPPEALADYLASPKQKHSAICLLVVKHRKRAKQLIIPFDRIRIEYAEPALKAA